MSFYKRVWIDREPEFEHIRRKAIEEFESELAQFPFRLEMFRFNKDHNGRRRRDAHWMIALAQARRELPFEQIAINGGHFFRTEEIRDQVKRRAEQLCTERPWMPKSPKTQQSLG